MATRPLRIAVAGTEFGGAIHVPALRSLPGVEIVAVAASTEARARRAAARLGIPVGCGGIAALLDRPLDAVTLALPPAPHEAAVAAALQRGVAILAEKPLARGAAEAAAFAAAAQDRITAVDFEFAELATFRALHRALGEGLIGAIRSVEIEWRTRSRALAERLWSWKTDAAQGGGVLNLLGTHLFYLIEWLLGPLAAIGSVELGRARTQLFAPAGATAAEESAALTLRLASGVPVAVAVTAAHDGAPLHRWTIEGAAGRAIIENLSHDHMSGFVLRVTDAAGAARRELAEPLWHGDGRHPPFRRLAARFVEGLREGRPTTPDFAAAARVQGWVEAVRTGAWPGADARAADGRR